MISPHDSSQPAPLRHAATVLLLREDGDGIEVLLTRRHENLAFMGGLWVFPGGTLSPADTAPESLARIPDDSKSRCARFTGLDGQPLAATDCLGIAVAAYRETFEETGVLLAKCADGSHCANDLLIRAQEQRRAIVSQPQLFASLLREENLRLDVDRLVYWAHWITPSTAPRRFDTRFFLASVPPRQTAVIDLVEAVEHTWASPAVVVAAATAGTMPVSQPTLYNLMELDASLRQHRSLDALLRAETQRRVVPVLPKLLQGTATVMVLPWDADYLNITGVSAPSHIEYTSILRSLPSRMTQRR